jgi:hypothetical protein
MAWVTEDTILDDHESPLGEEQCEPCLALFNPIRFAGESLTIDGNDHLKHFILELDKNDPLSPFTVTVTVNAAFIDSVLLRGMLVMFTRNTSAAVEFVAADGQEIIVDGLLSIAARGGSVGLTSVDESTWVLVGNNTLEPV